MNYDNDINKIKGFILIKSGRIYDPFLKIDNIQDILIKDGVINKISSNIPIKSNYKVLKCKNEIITKSPF
mgnify:CR=1 FL=1